jgi:hypothetical protein
MARRLHAAVQQQARALGSACRRHPLLAAVGAGLLLRLLGACGYGYFASDDYLYVVRPAWLWLFDADAPLPSDFRSELLPRLFSALLACGRALGLRDPARLISFGYAGLGLWSALAIVGVYLLARRRLGERAALASAWLMALQALMPRLSTRALVEVAAIPPLVFALVALEAGRARRGRAALALLAAAGALLGLGAMLRFQLGLLVPLFVGLALVRAAGDEASPGEEGHRGCQRLFASLLGAAALGVGLACAALAQGLLDWHTYGEFLAAPRRYLAFNLAHSSEFGVSPWYNYLLFFLVLTLPPVTFWLAAPFARAARRHVPVAASLGLFVAVHSFIGHKEERFMFTMLPLFFVLLGAAVVELEDQGRWRRRLARGFLAVNVVAALAIALTDGQRSSIDPLLEVTRRGETSRVLRVAQTDRQIPDAVYLASTSRFTHLRSESELLAAAREQPALPTRLLFDDAPPAAAVLATMAEQGYACGAPHLYRGDWADRLVVAVNPEKNQRRRPTVAIDCTPAPRR